jgi:hypothetical protein
VAVIFQQKRMYHPSAPELLKAIYESYELERVRVDMKHLIDRSWAPVASFLPWAP